MRDETRLPRAKPKASRDALAATRFSFLFEAQGKSALESSSPISLLNFHIDFLVDADTCECPVEQFELLFAPCTPSLDHPQCYTPAAVSQNLHSSFKSGD